MPRTLVEAHGPTCNRLLTRAEIEVFMPKKLCPPEDQLSSFAIGTLEESCAEELLKHVEQCPECSATLFNFDDAADTVMVQLRQVSLVEPFADEKEFKRGLAAALAIGEIAAIAASEPLHPPADLTETLPQLGEYRLLSKLGEGGMGTVYRAVHTRLGKIVAIKMLPVSQGANPAAIGRFAREMKAIGSLDHPHLIRAYDAGEIDNQHYLVMEYVDGVDLAVLSKAAGQLLIADACELIRQAAMGLEYAHQRGLVHRDIKPSNLMLTSAGQVKVLDMGLALLGHSEDVESALTSSGQIMGTIDYMAPEQGGDTHHVDGRADVYSLGATLYKLLTGHAPHANLNRHTTMQKLTALATQQPAPIQQRRADIPASLAAIIKQMLAREPNQRFASPLEVAKSLQPYVAGANLELLITRCRRNQENAAITSDPSVDFTELPAHSVLASSERSPSNIVKSLRTNNSPNWREIIRWTMSAGASFLVVLAAVLYFWQTPAGVVRIEINDPAIKIVFDQQGPEMTQTDQKVIRLRTGPHKLTVKMGDQEFDTKQFVLKNQTEAVALKIELLPGKILVSMDDAELDSRPLSTTVPANQSEPPAKVAISAIRKNNSTGPEKASGNADLDKPFALIRNGQKVSEFKTGAGALAELQAGDELEVHGNGPFTLPQIHLEGKGLVLRGAPGYRPRFVPTTSAAEQMRSIYNPWLWVKNGALELDGCEFDSIPGTGHMFVGEGGSWRITHCRLYQPDANNQGVIKYSRGKLHISDSVLLCGYSYGSILLEDNIELEFVNNLFWSSAYAHFSFYSKGKSKFSLSGNTFAGVSGGFALSAETELSVHSDHNLFLLNRGCTLIGSEKLDAEGLKSQIHWNGNLNLYDSGSGFLPSARLLTILKDSVPTAVVADSLADWKKYWGDQERDALSTSGPTLLHQAAWLPDNADDPLPRLRHWINRPLEHVFRVSKSVPLQETAGNENTAPKSKPQIVDVVRNLDVGPDWTIVGPGQGYLRARAAASHPVAENQLLPEAGDDGPITLLRTGQPDRAYPTLAAAVADALDGDSLAIHTGKAVAGIERTYEKQGKRLTLRAGYGYRPSVASLRLAPEDVWSIEGLHFTEDVTVYCPKPVAQGTSELPGPRLINCSFAPAPDWQMCVGPSLRLLADSDAGATCDVINCVLPNYISSTARRLKVVNSAICGFNHGNLETKWVRQFEIERCVVYSGAGFAITSGNADMLVKASHSWFEFKILRHGAENIPFRWEGDHNVYCHGPARWMDAYQKLDWIWDLNAWQSRWNSDANSRSGDAVYVDPKFYRVLPESPAHAAAEGKRDLGVDVSRFVKPTEARSP
ncbi:MAG: Serine/threonine protein kinase [Planctomycetaceae bacterium]|nr:Serine/threonine protein kinase [Planctomycetaceae bacterium]